MTQAAMEFADAAMFRLSEQFDGLATGRNQVPFHRVTSTFRAAHPDPLWRTCHDLMVSKSGPLFQHFLASVPCILEEMCRVNAALERMRVEEWARSHRDGHSFFALDAFDGSQARALTELSGGAFASHTCSPNPGNEAHFRRFNQSSAATFAQAPFFDAVDECLTLGSGSAFDVIYETAAFQFYGKNRARQIQIAAQVLKEDGLFICLEKALRGDPQLFELDEDRKDRIHKAKYFTASEIEWKKQQMLLSMHDGLVELEDLLEQVQRQFGHACILWNGGNFFEVAACRDSERLERFNAHLGDICLDDGFVLSPQVGRWVSI